MMSFEVPFEALGLTLVHFCWQGAVIAGAARLVTLATPGLKPGPRYTVHLLALIAMAATAVATFGWEWARLAAHDTPPADVLSVARVSAASGIAFKDVLPWLDTVWALGVIALSARMMGGLWLIHRLSAEAQAVPAALESRFAAAARALGLKNVRLRMHAGIDGPFVVGIVRSVVYLPVSAIAALSPDQLDAVLAHELEHIRRADFAWNLLQTAIETLFFYHPAVWWLGKTLRDQRELACDDAAVTLCRDPLTYATALLTLEERRPARKLSPSLAMALGGKDGSLLSRVRRVLGEGQPGSRSPARPALVAAPLLVAVLAAMAVPVSQVAAHNTGTTKKQCRIKATENAGGSSVETRTLATETTTTTTTSADAGESPAAEATDADVEPKDFWSGLAQKPTNQNRIDALQAKAGKMAQAWKIKAKDWTFDSDDWKRNSEIWADQARAAAEQAKAAMNADEVRRAQAEGLREGAEQARLQARAMADQTSIQAEALRRAADSLARQAEAMKPPEPPSVAAPVPPVLPVPPVQSAPQPPAPPKAPAPLASLSTPVVFVAKGLVVVPQGTIHVIEPVVKQKPIVVALNKLPDARPMAMPSPDAMTDVVVQTDTKSVVVNTGRIKVNPDVRVKVVIDGRS